MKLSRIDLIAQNGATGEHYKYDDVVEKILDLVYDYSDWSPATGNLKKDIIKLLVEAFPNDET